MSKKTQPNVNSNSRNSGSNSNNNAKNSKVANPSSKRSQKKIKALKRSYEMSRITERQSAGILTSSTNKMILSPSASDYVRALANPFTGPMACIPSSPALLTGRTLVWNKGTFATSSNPLAGGFGYIVCDPNWAAANDRGCVIYNSPAASTTVITTTLGVASGTTVVSNSPYTTAQFGNNLKNYRTVACGLKVTPIGPILTRGGLIVGLHQPAHASLDNLNISGLDAFQESGRFPVCDKTPKILYRPVDQGDFNFHGGFQIAGAGNLSFFMGFAVQAPDTTGANPQLFEYEFVSMLEIQGADVLNKVPSHVDLVGHGAVETVSVMAKKLHRPHTDDSEELAEAMHSATEDVVKHHTSNPSGQKRSGRKSGGHDVWDTVLDVGTGLLGGLFGSLF